MERRINKKITGYLTEFKDDIKKHVLVCKNDLENELGNSKSVTSYTQTQIHEIIDSKMMNLLQSIYDYENLNLKPEDYSKRKRTKNNIPLCEQCIAKRANGLQCSRRKKNGLNFCGTHVKGTPHGVVCQNELHDYHKNNSNCSTEKKVEVWLEDINGIMYYIDNNGNVYDTYEITSNTHNPKIIAKYSKTLVNGEEQFNIIKT